MNASTSFRDVVRVGAAAVSLAQAPAPLARASCGVALALRVQSLPDGRHCLVNTATGELLSPCASPAVGERTRAFFS